MDTMMTPAFQFDLDMDTEWMTEAMFPSQKTTAGLDSIPTPEMFFGWNGMMSPADMLKKQKAEEDRKIISRQRVARCRKRKTDRLEELEKKNQVLQSENIHLQLKKQKHGEETLTTEENDVLHSQHVSLLGQMVSLWSAPDRLAEQASTFWSESATMIQSSGTRNGADEIVGFYSKLNNLCQDELVVTDYSVVYDVDSVRKPRVQWSMELTLSEQCPETELAENWSKWAGQKLQLTGFSSLTFEHGKITQDI